MTIIKGPMSLLYNPRKSTHSDEWGMYTYYESRFIYKRINRKSEKETNPE